ncbi:hypothetical protein B989_00138 [Brucella sp. 56/94]|nr:hypothetical protein DK65_1522 [Brucella pinnipedialis]ENR13501.1 hypothetical protein C066_01798 [Brucella sp. UK5/01]ENT04103.1 hypothetical protein B989_00138 [Brucella sp. 56/94]ENT07544.1 hypothetical protein C983_01853 [Brucella sp. F23/97]ENT14735.1 hypothetical protein C067_01825 [Brucella sp. F8/99]ENT18676.1 hypothetical protein B998_00144 [Brucella sp. F96/2]ENT20867.1 hypothetical protein C065_01851 [Brucella sp. UK1/97]ENT21581.1 hypothetical protein C051_01902 [Brucella sp. 
MLLHSRWKLLLLAGTCSLCWYSAAAQTKYGSGNGIGGTDAAGNAVGGAGGGFVHQGGEGGGAAGQGPVAPTIPGNGGNGVIDGNALSTGGVLGATIVNATDPLPSGTSIMVRTAPPKSVRVAVVAQYWRLLMPLNIRSAALLLAGQEVKLLWGERTRCRAAAVVEVSHLC